MVFVDRRDAGRQLAALLVSGGRPGSIPLTGQRPVVMGMARGGVPVAFEVAAALDAPLDVVVVRKLGHPRQPELGLGAIAEDGVRVVNSALVMQLGVPSDVVDAVAAEQATELERRLRVYRGGRAPVPVRDRAAIVVDDGLATGFTARAAIDVMRGRGAARVVLAVPVGPPDTVVALRDVADDVVCVHVTERFFGLSEWYEDFEQVSDAEVARLLALGAPGAAGAAGAGGLS
jgi:putative phosphoribosyl transferase